MLFWIFWFWFPWSWLKRISCIGFFVFLNKCFCSFGGFGFSFRGHGSKTLALLVSLVFGFFESFVILAILVLVPGSWFKNIGCIGFFVVLFV